MPNTYKAKLDIKTVKPDFKPVFIQHNHARLEIKLMDNRLPYDLSAADRVEFTHERPDGLVIIYPGEIINGIICYEYKGTEMDVLGKVQTSLAVIDADNKTVSSHPFVVEIKENQRDKPFNPAEPNFGLLQTLIKDVEDLKENGGGSGTGGGRDGYTPVKGKDYFDGKDGYTPVKGVDYRDGIDGRTPIKGVDYVDGKDGEDGYTPIKGVDYHDGIDGKSFTYADFTQTQLEALRGPQGPQGADGYTPKKGTDYSDGVKGVDGKTWHITATAPSNTLGVIGDMHLNTATYDIREKTATSVWSVRGNIKGATGTNGTNGTNGKTWLTGTTAPTSGAGTVGDFYLNVSTWDIHEKTTATVWATRGNIKGAQGNPGSTANITAHEASEAPHQYGGVYEWRYNPITSSLDLVLL